jgi:hypothetical protein
MSVFRVAASVRQESFRFRTPLLAAMMSASFGMKMPKADEANSNLELDYGVLFRDLIKGRCRPARQRW